MISLSFLQSSLHSLPLLPLLLTSSILHSIHSHFNRERGAFPFCCLSLPCLGWFSSSYSEMSLERGFVPSSLASFPCITNCFDSEREWERGNGLEGEGSMKSWENSLRETDYPERPEESLKRLYFENHQALFSSLIARLLSIFEIPCCKSHNVMRKRIHFILMEI